MVESTTVNNNNNKSDNRSNTTQQQQGWSEPAATNAPVEDEAVQPVLGMNQNRIWTAQIYIFSPASTLPQNISPLPAYLPPPTSYLPPLTSNHHR